VLAFASKRRFSFPILKIFFLFPPAGLRFILKIDPVQIMLFFGLLHTAYLTLALKLIAVNKP